MTRFLRRLEQWIRARRGGPLDRTAARVGFREAFTARGRAPGGRVLNERGLLITCWLAFLMSLILGGPLTDCAQRLTTNNGAAPGAQEDVGP